MSFINYFTGQFAAYRKANKRKKDFKNLSTNKFAERFLQENGERIKAELNKYIRNGEKINFSGLPESVKKYFGKDYVAVFKRKLLWENAELLMLSGEIFKFNSGNKLNNLLSKYWNDKRNIKPAKIVDFIINQGNKEDEQAARLCQIKNSGQISNARTISQVFKVLDYLMSEKGYPNWQLFGLFNDRDDYVLFINVKI